MFNGVTDPGLVMGLQDLVSKVSLREQVSRVILVTECPGPELPGSWVNPPGQGIGDQVAPVIDKVPATITVPASGLKILRRSETGVSVITAVQEGSVASGGAAGPVELLIDDMVPSPGLGVED